MANGRQVAPQQAVPQQQQQATPQQAGGQQVFQAVQTTDEQGNPAFAIMDGQGNVLTLAQPQDPSALGGGAAPGGGSTDNLVRQLFGGR